MYSMYGIFLWICIFKYIIIHYCYTSLCLSLHHFACTQPCVCVCICVLVPVSVSVSVDGGGEGGLCVPCSTIPCGALSSGGLLLSFLAKIQNTKSEANWSELVLRYSKIYLRVSISSRNPILIAIYNFHNMYKLNMNPVVRSTSVGLWVLS